MIKVYQNEIDPQIVFEGTAEQCRKWIVSQIQPIGGRKIYRRWNDEERYFIDANGPVFFTYEEIFAVETSE